MKRIKLENTSTYVVQKTVSTIRKHLASFSQSNFFLAVILGYNSYATFFNISWNSAQVN